MKTPTHLGHQRLAPGSLTVRRHNIHHQQWCWARFEWRLLLSTRTVYRFVFLFSGHYSDKDTNRTLNYRKLGMARRLHLKNHFHFCTSLFLLLSPIHGLTRRAARAFIIHWQINFETSKYCDCGLSPLPWELSTEPSLNSWRRECPLTETLSLHRTEQIFFSLLAELSCPLPSMPTCIFNTIILKYPLTYWDLTSRSGTYFIIR